jgi:hypothetical protein
VEIFKQMVGFRNVVGYDYINGDITLTEEQQAIFYKNLKIMDLSQGVSNHKDELDSYENQFSQPFPTPNWNKFLDLCKEMEFNSILNNKERWYETFFQKNILSPRDKKKNECRFLLVDSLDHPLRLDALQDSGFSTDDEASKPVHFCTRMIKRRNEDEVILFSLIMMSILCDASADHVLMGQQDGLGLPGGA